VDGPGFLGTEASLGADLALVGSVVVMLIFTVGAWLALRRQYEAHRWAQTVGAVLNAALVFGIMIPALINVDPAENVDLPPSAFIYMTGHEIVGAVALLFGLFVVLRGNGLVPERLRFENYKLYMRWAYALYLIATLVGVAVYLVLYL
jgi:uncharacterized membrane protein YozB (DUF420 family)